MSPHIFATGADGFIGRALARATTVIPVPREDAAQFIKARAVKGDSLVHLAWPNLGAAGSSGGSAQGDDGWEAYRAASIALRETATGAGVRFIGIGSGVEGYLDGGALDEPYLTYAQRKAELHAALEGNDLSWLRLHFLFGPGEPARRIVPSAIRAAQAGTELICGARDRRRHWLHVDDLAAGLARFAADPKAGTWDVAGPRALSFDELFALVAEAVGKPVTLAANPGRPADARLSQIAPTRLAPVLPSGAGEVANLLARLIEYASSIDGRER